MDIENDGYDLCEDNWQKIRETEAVGNHLNRVQWWFEADKTPDLDLIENINQAAASTGRLLAHLIDLQIKLLTNL